MKRFVSILLVVLFLLPFVPTTVSAAPVIRVRVFIDYSCTESAGKVGNEITHRYTVSGRSVYSGDVLIMEVGKTYTFVAKFVEDDINADVGSSKYTFTFSQESYENMTKGGYTYITLYPVLRESSGRYAGSYRKYEVIFYLYSNAYIDSLTDDAYDEGYDSGYDKGYDEGYDTGYDAGYKVGSTDGKSTGSASGYDKGYADGVKATSKESYQSGYTVGRSEGEEKAKEKYTGLLPLVAAVAAIIVAVLCLVWRSRSLSNLRDDHRRDRNAWQSKQDDLLAKKQKEIDDFKKQAETVSVEKQKIIDELNERLDAASVEYQQQLALLSEQMVSDSEAVSNALIAEKNAVFLRRNDPLGELSLELPPGVGIDGDTIFEGKRDSIRVYGALTVYTSSYGRKFHAVRGCCGCVNQHNLYEVLDKMDPCSKCVLGRDIPDQVPEWYRSAKRLIRSRYNK